MPIKRGWLFQELRDRYEHPFEVRAYADQVRGGLLPEEEALLEMVLQPRSRVLDVGCGAGREAIALAKKGHRVVAVDISKRMLRTGMRLAAEQGVDISWLWMKDPLHVPATDSDFEIALGLAQLLSHIPAREARIRLLSKIRRALTPGGRFVGTFTDRSCTEELCGEDGLNELSALEREAGWEDGDLFVMNPSEADLDESLFFHLHTRAEIATELQMAGFWSVEIIEPADLTDHPAPDAHRYPFVLAHTDGKEDFNASGHGPAGFDRR